MAYAEKLVKSWRACYKGADGRIVKEPGFPTKTKALTHGRDQESKIRAGQWTDPRRGDMLFGVWATQWYDALDLDISSMETYKYVLEHHILPAWGRTRMRDMATAGVRIQAWTKRMREGGYSESTIELARGRLHSMLTDAVTDGIIGSNPLANPRGRRGKVVDRIARRDRTEPAWASPYQVLLIAERAALLTGRAEEFVRIVAMGWTGMRWSECAGLETSYLWGDRIKVEWQLRKTKQGHARKPPKDASRREIDIPPFLDELLAMVADERPAPAKDACPCSGNLPEEYAHPVGVHLFTGVGRPHWDRADFAARILGPAAEGFVNPRSDARRPVLVREEGPVGSPRFAAGDDVIGTPAKHCKKGLACWVPLVPGLTLHGLRHSHATWLSTAGIPESLRKERLGHTDASVHAGYTHIADESRERLSAELTRLWMDALAQRAAVVATSRVPVLGMLLGREESEHPQDHSRSAPDRGSSGRRKRRRRLRVVA